MTTQLSRDRPLVFLSRVGTHCTPERLDKQLADAAVSASFYRSCVKRPRASSTGYRGPGLYPSSPGQYLLAEAIFASAWACTWRMFLAKMKDEC